MEQNNKWDVYIGSAIEDKKYNSRLLKVHLTELLPYMEESELQDYTSEEQVNIFNDEKKSNEVVNVKATNRIIATWLNLFSNRSNPPDIRKGERVFVIRYRDDDVFRWIPLGIDDNLRRLEVLRFHVSDDKEFDKDLNDNNTYFIELDTLYDKRIILQTSKKDDEKYFYTIVLDGKNNKMVFKDNENREIVLKSDTDNIKVQNKSKTYVELAKKNLKIKAKGSISVNSEGTLLLKGKRIILKSANTTIVR
jgi:hypothetical protein